MYINVLNCVFRKHVKFVRLDKLIKDRLYILMQLFSNRGQP